MNTNPGRSRVRITAFAALATAATMLVGACGSGGTSAVSGAEASSGSGSSAAVRLGVEPWIGYGPWHVADKKGFFHDEGVDVTVTNFDADSDINAALASGKIDAASIASHTAMKFQEAGVDATIVLLLDASEEADAILALGAMVADELYAIALPIVRVQSVSDLPWVDEVVTVWSDVSTGRAGIRQ